MKYGSCQDKKKKSTLKRKEEPFCPSGRQIDYSLARMGTAGEKKTTILKGQFRKRHKARSRLIVVKADLRPTSPDHLHYKPLNSIPWKQSSLTLEAHVLRSTWLPVHLPAGASLKCDRVVTELVQAQEKEIGQ